MSSLIEQLIIVMLPKEKSKYIDKYHIFIGIFNDSSFQHFWSMLNSYHLT